MATTTYAYKVRDRSGQLIEGQLEAGNEQLVVSRLREMGYVPVSVAAKSRSMLSTDIKLGRDKVGLKDIAVFSRQLATMLSSGLALLRALAILAEQTDSTGLAKVIVAMKEDIERGLSLSQAIGRHPRVFPPIYVAMVRSGESAGALDDVLARLATTLEQQLTLRGKIRSAVSYPIAVAGIVIVIVTAMLLFVVPQFESMYNDLNGTLPLPTRILIGTSDVLTHVWWLIAAALLVAFLLLRRWVATPGGRMTFDRFKLRLPIFGSLLHKTALARFSRTLASLMRSGVPIMEAFDIVGETAGNAVIGAAVTDVRERVRLGESVADALSAHPVFPPMAVQMIAVGEESGAIDDLLERVADFYDQEIEASVGALTSLIEPILMVFMGAAVGGMVIALYMPMFKVIDLIK